MPQADIILGTTPTDGTAFVGALNAALNALSTCIYGPIDPATQPTKYNVQPGALWFDTSPTPNQLKARNEANDGWSVIAHQDGTPPAGIAAALATKLSLSGGVLSGFLTLHADPDAAMKAATKQYVDNTSRPAPIRFLAQGNASNASKLAQALIARACRMTAIDLYAETAPVGAALTVTLTRKRTAVADDSRSASITAGNNGAAVTLGTPMVLQQGDRIQFGITSVGSSTPGGNDLLVCATLDPP